MFGVGGGMEALEVPVDMSQLFLHIYIFFLNKM